MCCSLFIVKEGGEGCIKIRSRLSPRASVCAAARCSGWVRVPGFHISIDDWLFCRLCNDALSLRVLKRKHGPAAGAGSAAHKPRPFSSQRRPFELDISVSWGEVNVFVPPRLSTPASSKKKKTNKQKKSNQFDRNSSHTGLCSVCVACLSALQFCSLRC